MPGTALPPEPSSPRVLIIDDEDAILRLLQTLLARSHYEVATAVSANAALGLLEKEHFDCIITDAIMPEISGYDFVKTVRSNPRHLELPILMLTRKRHRQDVKKAVEAGVTDYIFKPIDENLLLEKLELCVKKGVKRGQRETTLPAKDANAELLLDCRIVSLSETTLTLRLPVRVERRTPFKLRSRLFADIGVEQPPFEVERCEKSSGPDANAEFPWEAKLSFAPTAADLTKLRSWLQTTQARK